MDTVAQHSKKLTSQFKRRKDSSEIIASAKRMAYLALISEDIHMRHRRNLLKEVLWWISEADGKYCARYRSKATVELAMSNPLSGEKVEHEHVFPKAKVARELLERRFELLDNPERLDAILDGTVGCVVLAREHKGLSNEKPGWGRYSGVTVLDMSVVPPVEYHPPA